MKDRRTQRKWQAKLSGLQAQIDSGRENLLLLEATLQNTSELDATTQLDTEGLVCLGSWQQDDAIPLPPSWSTDLNTAIVDAGASGMFFKAKAPVCNVDKDAPKIRVGAATGDPHISSAKCELARPELRGRAPLEGHVMPTFAHNLMGICQFCDADCTVQYTKKGDTIFDPDGVPLLRG